VQLVMGKSVLELGGSYLGDLREANDILDDAQLLNERMDEDGYLLLRRLQSRQAVLDARAMLLDHLNQNGQIDSRFPMDEAVVAEDGRGHFGGGRKELTHSPEFLSVVDSPEIMDFFVHFLSGDVITYDYKWLRVVEPGGNTGAHYDMVYMGRGTKNVYTCWTPFGDVGYELGSLAVLVGETTHTMRVQLVR